MVAPHVESPYRTVLGVEGLTDQVELIVHGDWFGTQLCAGSIHLTHIIPQSAEFLSTCAPQRDQSQSLASLEIIAVASKIHAGSVDTGTLRMAMRTIRCIKFCDSVPGDSVPT